MMAAAKLMRRDLAGSPASAARKILRGKTSDLWRARNRRQNHGVRRRRCRKCFRRWHQTMRRGEEGRGLARVICKEGVRQLRVMMAEKQHNVVR